jgi:hypothetical protein
VCSTQQPALSVLQNAVRRASSLRFDATWRCSPYLCIRLPLGQWGKTYQHLHMPLLTPLRDSTGDWLDYHVSPQRRRVLPTMLGHPSLTNWYDYHLSPLCRRVLLTTLRDSIQQQLGRSPGPGGGPPPPHKWRSMAQRLIAVTEESSIGTNRLYEMQVGSGA